MIPSVHSDIIQPRRRRGQNYLLIWLNSNVDESKTEYQGVLIQLRRIVDDVNVFINPDECIDFLTEIIDEKAFMIVSKALCESLVPNIHEIPQLDAIYILCSNQVEHELWTKEWPKVKGIYTQMTPIYEALQNDVTRYDHDSISISLITVGEATLNQNFDQIEPSFMYTLIFKEILLEMQYDRGSINNFTTYCRKGDYGSLSNINRFENEYKSDSAIWWYTYPSFIFSMLNRALRTLEADTIITMGFFIRDLHHQIKQLHQQQFEDHHEDAFTVYRGQGLSIQDFKKLEKTKGGLISFNNFLSTSLEREVALIFAINALANPDSVGILFRMTINPSILSVPFAFIDNVSSVKTEKEVLFSMHTAFRIREIKKIDDKSRLYQVELELTDNSDKSFRILTERIREETFPSAKGFYRICELLMKLDQFDKAEQVYLTMLQQITDETEKANVYNELGYIKKHQDEYEEAILFYKKALEIHEKTHSPNFMLAGVNNNIGLAYYDMDECSKALSFFEKALEITQNDLSSSYILLPVSYKNIGKVYEKMGESSKALSFFEKASEINRKTPHAYKSSLSSYYSDTGKWYYDMGDYVKTLLFYHNELEILQETYPPNHPALATCHRKIGGVYDKVREYSKALSFYEKALEIGQKALPANHPALAIYSSDIGKVYQDMQQHLKALPFYKKALESLEKTLPSNHPNLIILYDNIGLVYEHLKEYSEALLFYRKALDIEKKAFPPNYPSLPTSYNSVGRMLKNMGNYTEALPFYERALSIFQWLLPSNDPHLQSLRQTIDFMKKKLESNF